MRTQIVSKSFLSLAAALALAVAGACSTDSPTEPSRPPATPPDGGGGGTGAFSVVVTANPGTVAAGSDDPVLITVRATRDGQPAPDGTLAVVTALEGSFGAVGGPQTATVELTNGVAQVAFFPPVDEEQSVVVQATVAGAVGQTTIDVAGTTTFFVSHVEPASGSPQGGDTVTVIGSGFEEPVRVLFGGVNAQVLSVGANRIRVRTPPSPGAPNETETVAVSVTINVNEEETATDTVAGAFTFAPGGGDVRQPAIFSVTPTTGPNEGGTQVSIIGEGFQSPVQVRFCNGDCVEAQVLSVVGGRLEVRSPPATGFGSVLRDQPSDIQVTNLNSGLSTTFTDAFRYGVDLQVTGLSPDVVEADDPQLVTIFGSGFESPLVVTVDGVQQQVTSVTGSEVVFRPSARELTGCGTVTQNSDVQVRLLNSGEEAGGLTLIFRTEIPQPQILSVTPNTGNPNGNQNVNIGGSGFAAPVRVLFGGAAAQVGTVTPTNVAVTTPPLAGGLPTVACTTGTGQQGTRTTSQAVNVLVENLATGCEDVLPGGFTYTPANTNCVPNPACSDGIDNDGDGSIDAADPGCAGGPADGDETDPAP
ncbi:MAG TPA: IPT/TIG domain-containing protein [Thermoanaerobaculia bacterium]|nr:IPT/TIG domain-containing protein [Thermoanaerobaculia bacterium]